MGKSGNTVIYLVTEDWAFCLHRLNLARAARDAGYTVIVITQVTNHGELIRKEGFLLIPIIFQRSIRKPWQDIITLFSIFKHYRKIKPDIVHHVALKAVIYGSLVTLVLKSVNTDRIKYPVVINSITGLGFVFSSKDFLARSLRLIINPLLRFLIKRENSFLIVQNSDDFNTFNDSAIKDSSKVALICGSGVDTDVFKPGKSANDIPAVFLIGRMLPDKGVVEFINAARKLRNDNVQARFILVGDTDAHYPSAISSKMLENWQKEGVIEWWGHQDDMPAVYRQADIVCLPSYREGLPKVLIEAGACGLPVVTTDVPGCRDVVQNGVNGFLVPVQNSVKLAEALNKLISDPSLRLDMGKKNREIVVNKFSSGKIINETLNLYKKALS